MILRGLKDVSWAGAKAMMADASFLKTLIEFDKDSMSDKQVNVAVTHGVGLCAALSAFCKALPLPQNIPHLWQVKRVRDYMKDPKFTVDDIKSISTAGAGLLKWVFAMVNYYRYIWLCL